MTRRDLVLINARENNLKNLTLSVPHDELTVLTGLSGSGKSSLAFDTIYAEGQRRYIETFSPYTRQFLDRVKRPAIDSAENVRPAIAIQQRTRVVSSRSTVGTMTNLNDYLKLIWANLAKPVCPRCERPFEVWKPSSLASHIIKLSLHETFLIAAGVEVGQRSFEGEKERLISLGYSRFFSPALQEVQPLEHASSTDLADGVLLLVLDRIRKGSALTDANLKRLRESIEQAYRIGNESCVVLRPDSSYASERYSRQARCQECGLTVAPPRPSLFSSNHPIGACPDCKGFGKVLTIDIRKVIPDPSRSIIEHALQPWSRPTSKGEYRRLLKFCVARSIPTDRPWRDLSSTDQDLVMNYRGREYRGVLPWFKRLESKAYKMHVRVFLSKYREQSTCQTCQGSRLKLDALAYRIDEKTIADTEKMPIAELQAWIADVAQQRIADKGLPRQLHDVFSATIARLAYLNDLGLPYLTLDRQSRTLSGGETQRVNLATALGSELISTHFVLDEPSVGLHARDTGRLITAIRKLQSRGNSLLVVEHDTDCIASADHIIELGPQAGKGGGEVVFNGPSSQWRGIDLHPVLTKLSNAAPQQGDPTIAIRNATVRNLRSLNLDIPLNLFVCLTGVSGSGKSTIVHEVLKRAYDDQRLHRNSELTGLSVTGFEHVSELMLVDQSPLAKSPRANIATYSGIWDTVRDLLASTDDAQSRALGRSAFSFNVEGGRCPNCEGAGFIREDMQFLSDVFIECELCLGQRFQQSVLDVRYRGKNAHDFLQMTIAEAEEFFAHHARTASACRTLSDLGLGHLTLGHPLSELSGGEAQRLKLVPFVEKAAGRTLLIFDEPTTGLHSYDVNRLIDLFKALRDRGHSVLCIEHNLALIACSDWVIDIGPEGGDGGGEVVAQGTPRSLSKAPPARSHTAHHLKRFLDEISPAAGAVSPDKISRSATTQKLKRRPLTAHPALVIRGAREHNLKEIDVRVPLNTFVALTGVSGSGKSSIAKDIIYAEGQRRYLDCLSPYARQFIQELRRPDIDSIENVKPSICVYQHTFQPGRLSTVGTMSEAYNFLRLLYAKVATQFCPDHPEQRISPLSPDEIAEIIAADRSTTIRLLAPVIKSKKGNHRAVLERAVAAEITQVRIDGVFLNPTSVAIGGGLERSKAHTIELVVGKFNPKTAPKDLIREAVHQTLSLGGGNVIVKGDSGEELYSIERTCAVCKRGFFKPDPEDLSFHSKRGRCSECEGTGITTKGAVCPACHGSRINERGRNLRIDGRNIFEISSLTVGDLQALLEELQFDPREYKIAQPILHELSSRLATLSGVGLEKVSLARECTSLSGGELQRLRLATAMGSPLTGALYIFDEPSAGLHPFDNQRVLSKFADLRDRGNSIIMIEHDAESILAADYVIEVGPGGGRNGGTIVYEGDTSAIAAADTATGLALRTRIEPEKGEKVPSGTLTIENGTVNNVRDLSLTVPLGAIVTFCGISGAGKSSIVHQLLSKTLTEGKKAGGLSRTYNGCTVTPSFEIARVLEVDQKPIGLNSRSTPASYLGIFDHIRRVFSTALEAKARGWTPSFFSYNTGKGRCPACKGLGEIRLEMSFLPDAAVECESCGGRRFGAEAESVLYQGMTISDVLKFTFEEAKVRFAHHRPILEPLRQACELGLGYLTLGQSSTTLSGGESQRLKLIAELSGSRKGHTLYLLDEPTTGLHKADVARLMKTLRELVQRGNSVIIIEHDADAILLSDHLIEVGPGAGDDGGQIIFQGTPAELVSSRARTPWQKILSRREDPRTLEVQLR